MGAFRQYSMMFAIIIFGMAAITSFSGSIFNSYNVSVDSDTLNKIKDSSETVSPSTATQRNRTANINPDESTFLSPQAFGVIGDTLSSAGNVVGIISTAERELGLPGFIGVFIVAIVTITLIWAAVSALFGWEL